MDNNQKTQQKKPAYKGFTFKERLVPAIMLSLIAPFMVCFFGPFDIYGNNFDQFKFTLQDFWLTCILLALGIAAVLCTLLLLLRGRAFDIAFGLVFGLSLMLFLQGNFLSIGNNSLAGDDVGDGQMALGKLIVNAAIWVIVTAGCIVAMLLLHRYRDTVRLIAIVALVAVLGSSLISFATVSLTTDVYKDYKSALGSKDPEQVLTVKNLDTLAKEQNVIVFIVDRFDYEYYDRAIQACPEIFDEMDGFTYFDDYVTLYPRTFPGVLHILTGVETDFSTTRQEYMEHAFTTSPLLHSIKDAGFDINIYTDDYYCYEDASVMSSYTENTSGNVSYNIVEQKSLAKDMLRLSLLRYLPFAMHGLVGEISTPTFDRYVEYNMPDKPYSLDMREVYGQITDGEFTLRKSDKGFSFIHIDGCHRPFVYDENFNELDDDDPLRWDSNNAMKQSFKIISAYIREMKRLGVYDDATIIITGDHASIGADDRDPYYEHVTALFVKPAGATGDEISVSDAQIGPDDVFATILAAVGAPDHDRTVFEIPEDEQRTRRYLFQRKHDGVYEQVIYRIEGDGMDIGNWHVERRYELEKDIYD